MKIQIVRPSEAEYITHNGVFHADEVMATVILRKFAEYHNPRGEFKLARVNNVPKNIDNENVIIYDVGHGKYDHHQKGGNGEGPGGIKYSSAGLIWRDYGEDITGSAYLYNYIYNMLIAPIDAYDNGIYHQDNIPTLNVSNVISVLNPSWNEMTSSDQAFIEACEIMTSIFERYLEKGRSQMAAYDFVNTAIDKTEDEILVLPKFAPWTGPVYHRREEKNILFCAYPSNRGGYNVQCVNNNNDRKPILPFPEEWRGLSREELSELTGIADAIFVHPAGFIAGAASLDGVVALAKLTIEQSERKEGE